MGRKRIKIQMEDIYNMGIRWFEVQRVHDKDKNYGDRYLLTKKLTDTQKEIIGKYKNVVISSCQYRYAPEIKYDTIIILDKCIKENCGK